MLRTLLLARGGAIACLIYLSSIGTPAAATSVLPPPTKQALARVWIARGEGLTARLELDPQGAGTLIVDFGPRSSPRAFRVTKSFLAEYALSTTLVPVDPDPDGLVLHGRATRYYLDLELRGTTGTANGVFTRLHFEPYDRVLRDLHAVDARAAALRRVPPN